MLSPTVRSVTQVCLIGVVLAGAVAPIAAQEVAEVEVIEEGDVVEVDVRIRPTSGSDRFFLNFAPDATVVDRQWWEGQLELARGNQVDLTILRLVGAFQPIDNWEFGGRVGFGSSSTPPDVRDGSGATDLDLYGKYYFGGSGDNDTEFAVGAEITVPTGDDAAFLGTDAWSLGIFGSLRQALRTMVISANLGLRATGDGEIGLNPVEGETSGFLGIGFLFPISDALTVVAEGIAESERFEGAGTDSRLLGGINWRVTARGQVRAALSVGLTDGAPDAQIFAGYAATF